MGRGGGGRGDNGKSCGRARLTGAKVVGQGQPGIGCQRHAAGHGLHQQLHAAAADVGISMGVRGSPASAESADAVLLVDNLGRIAEAVEIAQRSRAIALQSVYVGLALSLGAMVAAAFGYLSVVEGALFQEVIDVAVILNALRALR